MKRSALLLACLASPTLADPADRIVALDREPAKMFRPDHPKADAEGYVFYPNVNPVEEMANMIAASRSFQMNVEVMNSAKQMVQRVLTLGQ